MFLHAVRTTHPPCSADHSPSTQCGPLTLHAVLTTHPPCSADHPPSMQCGPLTLNAVLITHPPCSADHSPSTHPPCSTDHSPSMQCGPLTLHAVRTTHPPCSTDHLPSTIRCSISPALAPYDSVRYLRMNFVDSVLPAPLSPVMSHDVMMPHNVIIMMSCDVT